MNKRKIREDFSVRKEGGERVMEKEVKKAVDTRELMKGKSMKRR